MPNTMNLTHVLQRLIDIRSGEYRKTALMALYIFFLLVSFVTIKAVRDALFLVKLGPTQLPYIYILVAVIVGVVAWIHAKLSARFRLDVLIRGTLLIVVANLLIFWWLFRFGWPSLYYVFYIWAAAISLITMSQYWLLANSVFNAREAKRLFGPIGAGSIIGGFVGGVLTSRTADWIGTENLLLGSAAGYLLCAALASSAGRSAAPADPRSEDASGASPRSESPADAGESILTTIRTSPYLLTIAGLIGIGEIVVNLIDYQFKVIAAAAFPSKNALAGFMGTFSALVSVSSLIVQVFFTGRILRSLGIGLALLCLPVGLLFGSVAIAVVPSLTSAVMAKIGEGSLRYSINKAGLELLYLPVLWTIKARVKPFIDPAAERVAGGVGGLILIVATGVLSLSTMEISFVTIGLLGLWIPLVLAGRRQYVDSLRLALEQRRIDPTSPILNLSDRRTVDLLKRHLLDADDTGTLYVLRLLEQADVKPYIPALKQLFTRRSPEVQAAVIRLLSEIREPALVPALMNVLGDQEREMVVGAMRVLDAHPGSSGAKLDEWVASTDPRLAAAAIIGILNDQAQQRSGATAEQALRLMSRDHGPQGKVRRREAARALGWVHPEATASDALIGLLRDDSLEVVITAIKSAGRIQRRELVPPLVALLTKKETRGEAKTALVAYGSKILGGLADLLEDDNERMELRRRLPSLLAEIGGERTIVILLRNLSQPDRLLRYQVVKALNRIRAHDPNLEPEPEPIDAGLTSELRRHYELLLLFHSPSLVEDSPGGRLLKKALQERLDHQLEMVFRLLALRFPVSDIRDAYAGLAVDDVRLRAIATEYMDNLLPSHLKQYLIPIIDDWPSDALVEVGRQFVSINGSTRDELILYLLKGTDLWLKTCAVYVAGEWKRSSLLSELRQTAEDSGPLIRETVHLALERAQR